MNIRSTFVAYELGTNKPLCYTEYGESYEFSDCTHKYDLIAIINDHIDKGCSLSSYSFTIVEVFTS